jgi:hypothetical protein
MRAPHAKTSNSTYTLVIKIAMLYERIVGWYA